MVNYVECTVGANAGLMIASLKHYIRLQVCPSRRYASKYTGELSNTEDNLGESEFRIANNCRDATNMDAVCMSSYH